MAKALSINQVLNLHDTGTTYKAQRIVTTSATWARSDITYCELNAYHIVPFLRFVMAVTFH